jgi:hypothetical protein
MSPVEMNQSSLQEKAQTRLEPMQARLEPKTPPAAPLSLPFNTGRGGHPTPTQLEDYGDLGLIFTDLGLTYI